MDKEVNSPDSIGPKLSEHVLDLDAIGAGKDQGISSVLESLNKAMIPSQEMLKTIKAIGENTKKFDFDLPQITLPELTPRIPASALISEHPAHKTNRLLAQLVEKIDTQNKQSVILFAPTFDPTIPEVIFANKRIPFRKDTNHTQLLASLFTDLSREWSWDELLEDWEYAEDWPDKEGWRVVYEAARGINEKIASKTTVEDFLLFTKKVVRVNPMYVGGI